MTKRSRTAKTDRTYDAEGYTKRAGCLCFKTDREEEVSGILRQRFKRQFSMNKINAYREETIYVNMDIKTS